MVSVLCGLIEALLSMSTSKFEKVDNLRNSDYSPR